MHHPVKPLTIGKKTPVPKDVPGPPKRELMRMSVDYGFVKPEKVQYPRSLNASPKIFP